MTVDIFIRMIYHFLDLYYKQHNSKPKPSSRLVFVPLLNLVANLKTLNSALLYTSIALSRFDSTHVFSSPVVKLNSRK